MKFLRSQPASFYSMEVYLEESAYDDEDPDGDCNDLGWDEGIARGKVIEAWNKQQGNVYLIRLCLNTEIGDSSIVDEYNEEGWAGGKNPKPISTDIEVEDWDKYLKSKDRRSRLVRKRVPRK